MDTVTRLSVSLILVTGAMACADDETTPATGPVDYASVTAGGSFKDDVMPLFARSCALAQACHQGDAGVGAEGLGLGDAMDVMLMQSQIDGIHDALMTQAPNKSNLSFIKANDPNGSWLLAKCEYVKADLELYGDCKGDCGGKMPIGATAESGLSREELDRIAGWILDGAQNN